MSSGKFIVLEGVDGCGSTTQAKVLHEKLLAKGVPTVLTCEPCRGPIGTLIRQHLRKELTDPKTQQFHSFDWDVAALLFAADRMDHIHSEIEPALAKGIWVISDRYTMSSLTYQSLTAGIPSQKALAWIQTLNSRALTPDLTIILQTSAEVSAIRRANRGGKEEVYEGSDLQKALTDAYLDPRVYLNQGKVASLDGNQGVEDLAQQVWLTVTSLDRSLLNITKEEVQRAFDAMENRGVTSYTTVTLDSLGPKPKS